MIISNMHEAKTNLSKLIAEVLKGKDVVIAQAGEPVVKLIAYKENRKARVPGRLKGKIKISEDFDEESDEINELFYGKE